MSRKPKQRKSFTLIEIMLTIVVISVLASVSIVSYRGVYEKAQEITCEANLEILNTAVELYGIDRDQLPAYLSEVWPKYREEAIALFIERHERDKTPYMLALNSVRWVMDNVQMSKAYAQTVSPKYYGNDASVLDCPKDSTPRSEGGYSYGLNDRVANMTYIQYKQLEDFILLADCDVSTFHDTGDLASTRHGVFTKKALGITKGARKGRKNKDDTEFYDKKHKAKIPHHEAGGS